MGRQKKLLCRGARITHVDQRVAEGNCFARVHVACDLTKELVEELGWESVLHEGQFSEAVKKLVLGSELRLEEIGLKLNGTAGTALECVATEAKAFTVSRIKGDTEGSLETVLYFQVVTTAWQLVTDYFGRMGEAEGVLSLVMAPEQTKLQVIEDKQMQLGDDATEDADDDGEASGETGKSRPGDIAPKAVVLGNRRPRPSVLGGKPQ